MRRLPPSSTRTDTLLPYTTLFRSLRGPSIPTAFLPAQADKFVLVNVAPDPGLSQERLLDATERIEEGLAADPEVSHYQTTLGAGGGLQTLRAAIGGRGQG